MGVSHLLIWAVDREEAKVKALARRAELKEAGM
jgi:hypothetical protein